MFRRIKGSDASWENNNEPPSWVSLILVAMIIFTDMRFCVYKQYAQWVSIVTSCVDVQLWKT